ncbi:Predicted amidohydrolase [Propionibacterium cyclohexanicum]|uniref:Predicted amidohydrolase n=1 Tax=Propionibacterium cyclohexanicum TaxID=64702 RepID=A0A1H9QHX5_9ACTN|nr:carbon-nitrogen hydrolase family protein [Propionibacterium cyclohexanicum]SER60030.1 Predicted amidohydrolase [Propionibacterium cyclohexanicum]
MSAPTQPRETHRPFQVLAVQATPLPLSAPPEHFERHCRDLLDAHPQTQMMVWPEMHLCADGQPDLARPEVLRAAAQPLDGPLVARLGRLARELGVWLVPGSLCELGPGGELFNTAVVLGPRGDLVASYRKIFPWRPEEPYTPGGEFCVFDIEGVGRFGLTICFDSWFPEVARNLAWLGAQTILNLVKTTTPDREQEMVLARAHAITQQINVVTLNAASPPGVGRSAAFGPQGEVLAQLGGCEPGVLEVPIDHDEVHRVRREGTAGVTRPWAFFREDDAPLQLPAYRGSIDPRAWSRD